MRNIIEGKSKWFLSVMSIVLSIVLIQPAHASEPIKIGVLVPLTGGMAVTGREALKGLEIARDIQNNKGGIKGRQIEYVVTDTPDSKSAIGEAERLMKMQGINIIVVAYGSGLSYAVAPIAERNQKISWHVNSATDKITQGGFKYLFRTSGSAMDEGKIQADFAEYVIKTLKMKKEDTRVAIVYEDGVMGTTMGSGGEKRAKELGLNIVATESYSASTQDLSSLVMRVKNKKPDILFYGGYPPDAKIFLRQMQTLGLKVKAFIGTGASIGDDWFRDTYGDKANTFFSSNWPIERTSAQYAPGMPEFVRLYKDKYKKDHLFSCHSATAFTGMLILWDVLQRTKNVDDTESIRQAAVATDIPPNKIGCGWGAKFAPPGDPMMGTNLRAPVVITQWLDKELFTVWPVPYPGKQIVLPMAPW